MPRVEIIPTVVPTSLKDIERVAERAEPFARAIHIDICDGTFAPNTTWMPSADERFTMRGAFLYEVHLMVALPREVGLRAIAAGASRIIGHVEAMGNKTPDIFSAWKAAGANEVGLGVLFDTSLESLDTYAGECDVVQMMSIKSIGVQGIPYAPESPARIASLHARHPNLLIADDGGVSEANIADLAKAGVSRFCVGSALSRAADPASTYAHLLALAQSAVE